MISIHKILNRIRWDKEFGKGYFTLGYFDRVENQIKFISFEDVHFDKADHFYFKVKDSEGETHSIPFHRVKEIYKDGKLIWQRPHGQSIEDNKNS